MSNKDICLFIKHDTMQCCGTIQGDSLLQAVHISQACHVLNRPPKFGQADLTVLDSQSSVQEN